MTPRHMANARLDWQYRPDMNFYTQANYTGKQVWAAQRNGQNSRVNAADHHPRPRDDLRSCQTRC